MPLPEAAASLDLNMHLQNPISRQPALQAAPEPELLRDDHPQGLGFRVINSCVTQGNGVFPRRIKGVEQVTWLHMAVVVRQTCWFLVESTRDLGFRA